MLSGKPRSSSCRFFQLTILQHILYMSGYGGFVSLKKFRHLVCREPHGVVLQSDLYLRFSIGRLVSFDLSFIHCALLFVSSVQQFSYINLQDVRYLIEDFERWLCGIAAPFRQRYRRNSEFSKLFLLNCELNIGLTSLFSVIFLHLHR